MSEIFNDEKSVLLFLIYFTLLECAVMVIFSLLTNKYALTKI